MKTPPKMKPKQPAKAPPPKPSNGVKTFLVLSKAQSRDLLKWMEQSKSMWPKELSESLERIRLCLMGGF